jgi:hypothetical protein
MKKLSEIGLSRDNFIEKYSEYFKNTGPAVALTADDRREFVRESIYRFILNYIQSYQASDSLGKCMEKFFKEQGI